MRLRQRAVEWRSHAQVFGAESAVAYAPLEQKLPAAVIFLDAAHALADKMVAAADAHTFIIAHACLPQFHHKIGIGIHARRKLGAESAHHVPHAPVHHQRVPTAAIPVGVWVAFILRQQFAFAKCVGAVAKILGSQSRTD